MCCDQWKKFIFNTREIIDHNLMPNFFFSAAIDFTIGLTSSKDLLTYATYEFT